MTTQTILLFLVALTPAAFYLFGKRMIGTEARDRRRRSRSYRRVVSRRHRPTVKLAVNTGRA